MVQRGFKDLPRKTASHRVLYNKAFNVPKNPKYIGHKVQWFIKFLIKRLLVVLLKVKLR